eukprot:scaffold2917_cov191-Amphora_coffeaeformis.AAC.24
MQRFHFGCYRCCRETGTAMIIDHIHRLDQGPLGDGFPYRIREILFTVHQNLVTQGPHHDRRCHQARDKDQTSHPKATVKTMKGCCAFSPTTATIIPLQIQAALAPGSASWLSRVKGHGRTMRDGLQLLC